MSPHQPSSEMGKPTGPEVDLNVGGVDGGASKQGVEDPYQGPQKHNKIRWQWNLPLLFASIGFVVVAGLGGAALYRFQSGRVTDGLRVRAESSRQAGDSRAEAKWLSQLLSMNPTDKEALVRWSLAVDDGCQNDFEADEARRA